MSFLSLPENIRAKISYLAYLEKERDKILNYTRLSGDENKTDYIKKIQNLISINSSNVCTDFEK